MIGPVSLPIPPLPGDPGGSGGEAPTDAFEAMLATHPGVNPIALPLAVQPDGVRSASAPAAERFNEQGLFGHARLTESPVAPIPGEALRQVDDVRASTFPAFVPDDAASSFGAIRAPAPAGAVHAIVSQRSAPPLVSAEPMKGVAGPAGAPAPRRLPVEKIAAPAIRRPVRQEPAARHSPIQVALSEVERGIQVAVRVDGLGAEERDALRTEIAALLARHGLAHRGIRIAARAGPHMGQGGNGK